MSIFDALADSFLGKGRKRIMRNFALDEISVVTRPAQAGAQMVIMKSADSPKGEPVQKKFELTSAVNGHAHILDINNVARMHGGGYTDYSGGENSRHNHPFSIDDAGRVTIGEQMGHTHAYETEAKTEKGSAMLLQQDSFMKAMVGKADIHAELEKLANERVEKSGYAETYEQAFARILETPRGSDLYAQYLAASR